MVSLLSDQAEGRLLSIHGLRSSMLVPPPLARFGQLPPGDPDFDLFRDPANFNFYLNPNVRAIDSGVDSLLDRFNIEQVKNLLGIADSPISGLSKLIGGAWIIIGSVMFFGIIVSTVTAYFMHVNSRHHSVALVGAPVRSMHHLMVEYYQLDDVGQGLGR